MHNHRPAIPANAALARRATGAMFFSVFGGAWLMLWAQRSVGLKPMLMLAIASGTLALFLYCRRRYVQHRAALGSALDQPKQASRRRTFIIVNVFQWTAIIVLVNVFQKNSMHDWIFPAVFMVVGLHFLPLAKVSAYPAHYVTGAALIILATAYPLLAPQGPRDAVGCLLAGLMLWASALWAVSQVTEKRYSDSVA